jgi:D-beta-D-heptose 7-phosphate kinase/D-beta-D-heptose 1-phosphate adenosyltransferase
MKRIVVNGTFDILHRGHIELLNHAKSLGDYLLVCIDSDALVSYKKGQDRPVNNQWERMLLLKNLKAVDDVWIFNSDTELEDQLCEYKPHVMVKGSDYRNKPIVGAEFCIDINFFERLYEYSTTKTIQDIIDRG